MKKLLIFLSFTLTSCATLDPSYYQSVNTAKLCMDYLTLPSFNINQSAREEELNRRGEDCSSYAAAASVKNQSNAAFERTLRDMQRDSVPKQNYQQGTHTYIINGKHVTCTTNGGYTNCF
jgi:hypothetical protein